MDIKHAIQEISNLEHDIEVWKQAKRDADERLRVTQCLLDGLKAEIIAYMQENGVKQDQVDEGMTTILVTLTDGRESVDCPDLDAVPDEFIKVTKALDKKAVGEFIKSSPLPNWATIKRGNPFITIKSVMK